MFRWRYVNGEEGVLLAALCEWGGGCFAGCCVNGEEGVSLLDVNGEEGVSLAVV